MNILFLIIGLGLGFALAFLLSRTKQTVATDTAELDAKINALLNDILILNNNITHHEKETERLSEDLQKEKQQHLLNVKTEREKGERELKEEKEKLMAAETRIGRAEEIFKAQKSELENIKITYKTEFENLANKILKEKSETFTEQNKINIEGILNPLKERIKEFEVKVDKTYKAESDERINLKSEIKMLVDLNKQVSEEANNLATAIKGDNKMQGNWGEYILENIFERSGLIKDQEYKKEYSTINDEGSRSRPDFVVLLPDNKHVIVDSKVSLIAYEKCVNADNAEDREKYLREHIASVRKHVKDLSERSYQALGNMDTPDFVLLFIPIESSFSIAVQADNELFNFAWDKQIVIVCPSTLLATLRTIASVWKRERQTKNVLEIAKQSGALYDKFVLFIDDLDKIGKSIATSQTAYDSAINKLSKGNGNLVKRAQDIEKLGAKTTKQIASKFIESNEPKELFEEQE